MSNLKSCDRCGGFVPVGRDACPNCNSSHSWWRVPLAVAGAGFAAVTLSACYGPACVTQIKRADGTFASGYGGGQCGQLIDCTKKVADGGLVSNDPEFATDCRTESDGGSDAGAQDGGARDAGSADAGP